MRFHIARWVAVDPCPDCENEGYVVHLAERGVPKGAVGDGAFEAECERLTKLPGEELSYLITETIPEAQYEQILADAAAETITVAFSDSQRYGAVIYCDVCDNHFWAKEWDLTTGNESFYEMFLDLWKQASLHKRNVPFATLQTDLGIPLSYDALLRHNRPICAHCDEPIPALHFNSSSISGPLHEDCLLERL